MIVLGILSHLKHRHSYPYFVNSKIGQIKITGIPSFSSFCPHVFTYLLDQYIKI